MRPDAACGGSWERLQAPGACGEKLVLVVRRYVHAKQRVMENEAKIMKDVSQPLLYSRCHLSPLLCNEAHTAGCLLVFFVWTSC